MRSGEKALVTFHTIAFEGSIGIFNTLVAARLLRKGYEIIHLTKSNKSTPLDGTKERSWESTVVVGEKVSLNKYSKESKCARGEKDWFHLLLEIERRFRAEERKNRCSEGEIRPKLIKETSEDDSV